ncbi:hypothetical protein CO615_00040 [Lysobacteraceae bacterium NML75-0749]|nr:hypothetical protein CO615_00040 [Xanthomonadaceae bacterium NML75-0749]
MKDYSYLSSGIIYLREIGGDAPLIDVGNCSGLTLTPQEDSKSLADYRNPGGGTYNEVQRLTGVEMSYTFHDFSPANLARALRGGAATVAGGTVSAEKHTVKRGGFVMLAKLPKSITSVSLTSGGAKQEGTDYEVRPGGLYIPATSSITDGAEISVNYTAAASEKVQALVNSAKEYEMVFVGVNEARGGKQTRIHAFRVSHGLLREFAAIGDEYGAGEVSGKLLADPSKTGVGQSKYFTVEIED